jgi:PadR family transcriptional regulator, regulatory protein PadR
VFASILSGPYVGDIHVETAYSAGMRGIDITPRVAQVLNIFLEDPTQPRYGFELMKRTNMASGSLYPLLARLVADGWLTRSRERLNPSAAGRPPRMHYRIVGSAVPEARLKLAELSERYRPPESGGVPAPVRVKPVWGM